MLRDTARVISTVSDGPSEAAGILAGDRIITINDSAAVGMTADQVRDRLKGRIGTDVRVTVRRALTGREHSLTITRDRIPLYTVDASYMVDDRTGYIRINRFAMTTRSEEHTSELQSRGHLVCR